MRSNRVILAFGLAIIPALLAALQPAAIFTDHAILPRDRPVPVWGTATPGEIITVNFAGYTSTATADADGRWQTTLPALDADATGRDLVIAGTTTVTLTGILVGEVWLASGQSNMQWALNITHDGSLDIASSAALPGIREFAVDRRVAPASDGLIVSARGWQRPGPDTTARFSAVAYYFARELHLRLNVPVGIVNSSWGGTQIEPWISPAGVSANEAAPAVAARWAEISANHPAAEERHRVALAAWEKARDDAREAGADFTTRRPNAPEGPAGRQHPGNLFHGMIEGLAPFPFQGVIWYQGESNADRADQYRSLFPGLIHDWRNHFADPDLDFFWVQLASFNARNPDGTNWAHLRDAQTATLSLPRTGQAVILDVSNVNDIHPRNKLDVGRRLARLALNRTYGLDVPDQGPTFAGATREADAYRLAFLATDGGLFTPDRELGGFELAGADKVFHPTTAKIEGATVLLSTPAVPDPIAVRYAWRNAPAAGLFNQEGLPATPFRTDDW